MLPPRVLELVFDSSDSPSTSDGDVPASSPTMFVAPDAHLRAELVAPTALPAPPRMPSDAVQVPPPPRMPTLMLVESPSAARPSSRPTVRVGSNRSQKVVRVLRHTPSRPPPPPSMPPPPGSAPIRKAA